MIIFVIEKQVMRVRRMKRPLPMRDGSMVDEGTRKGLPVFFLVQTLALYGSFGGLKTMCRWYSGVDTKALD
jgi:hypothetical protein